MTDFLRTHERVVVYICDDSDSKADARRKLFDRWFRWYKAERYAKMTIPLGVDDANGVYYVAELFSRLDNPYFAPVFESFKRTVSGDK